MRPIDILDTVAEIDTPEDGLLVLTTEGGKSFYRTTIPPDENRGAGYQLFVDNDQRNSLRELTLEYIFRLSSNWFTDSNALGGKLPGFTGTVQDVLEGFGGDNAQGNAWSCRLGVYKQSDAKRVPIGLYLYDLDHAGYAFGLDMIMTSVPVNEWIKVKMTCTKQHPSRGGIVGFADFDVTINGVNRKLKDIRLTKNTVDPNLGIWFDVYHGGSLPNQSGADETCDFLQKSCWAYPVPNWSM